MLYKSLLVPLICIGSLLSYNFNTLDLSNWGSLPLQNKIKKESEVSRGGIINNLNAAYKIGSLNNFGNYTLNGVNDLGSINLELFYDSSIIRINALNSSGNESFKDIKFTETSVKMSFLFSSSNENIDLFNIDFDVIGGTSSTTTSLTLLVNEAYSLDHSPLNVKGNQHNIHLLNDRLDQSIENFFSSKEN